MIIKTIAIIGKSQISWMTMEKQKEINKHKRCEGASNFKLEGKKGLKIWRRRKEE